MTRKMHHFQADKTTFNTRPFIDKSKTCFFCFQEIAELSAQLKDLALAAAEATKLRTEEKAAFTKASTDYKESAEAVAQAMEVLREYSLTY